MNRFLRRWGMALALLAVVAVYALAKAATGDQQAMVWAGILLPACYVLSPLFFPRRSTRAQALAHPERVAVYVRPADVWSIRLRLGLGRAAKKALWIDALADPEAEAWVREVNRGDVLTPTVVVGDEIRRNPDVHWVGRNLTQRPAPE